jgi:hypothetical protein
LHYTFLEMYCSFRRGTLLHDRRFDIMLERRTLVLV